MVHLAKPALDVGLYTNDLDPTLTFWQQTAGVAFDELLPLGGGRRQHRHRVGDSIIKINHSREPLPGAPACGYRELLIATDRVQAATALTDPNGCMVSLVPPGHHDVEQLELVVVTRDAAAQHDFYGQVLGLPRVGGNVHACGASRLRIVEGPANIDPVRDAPGFRYITLQVFDVKSTHAEVLAAGGREGLAPVKLGDVAHISFVRDPDGNWIELSQRKSITGNLD